MEKKIVISICVVLVSFFFSCDKTEESGSLPGMWQLLEIERNSVLSDVKQNKVYWLERNGLLQFKSPNQEVQDLYAHVIKRNDSLFITDFCFPADYTTESDDNSWISYEERSALFPWGIYAKRSMPDDKKLESYYRIIKLDDERMILRSDSATLTFRKF